MYPFPHKFVFIAEGGFNQFCWTDFGPNSSVRGKDIAEVLAAALHVEGVGHSGLSEDHTCQQ